MIPKSIQNRKYAVSRDNKEILYYVSDEYFLEVAYSTVPILDIPHLNDLSIL